MEIDEYNERVREFALENTDDRDFHAYVAWLSNAGMDVMSPWDIAWECDVPRDEEHIPLVVESMREGFEMPENREYLNFEYLRETYL